MSIADYKLADFDEIGALAREFEVDQWKIRQTVELLDSDNTVWFIARYRKEQTGELDEEVVQRLSERLHEIRALQARRQDVMRLLYEQGHLTDELRAELNKAETLQRIDDLYRPFRPKRRTRAGMAREKGLMPLARAMTWLVVGSDWRDVTSLEELAHGMMPLFKGVESPEEAIQGAQDIIAEWVTDDADLREEARHWFHRSGKLCVEPVDQSEEREPGDFDDYFGFQSPLTRLRPHQILAIDRGEKAEVLRVRCETDDEAFVRRMEARVERGKLVNEARIGDDGLFDEPDPGLEKGVHPAPAPVREEMKAARTAAIADGYRRLLRPSVEREVRGVLTKQAHDHAIRVFGNNLKQLLLQPPIASATVLAIDPGYRAGCKVSVVSPTGELLDTDTVFPHPPQNQWEAAVSRLARLVTAHDVDVIAIGNGTASRETQRLAVEVIEAVPAERNVRYIVVDEAGASVYSASEVAREEFPDIDVALRGAVSIARRLQDPLAELVKIDPKSIGVGLYQHDVDQSRLADSLSVVVESCVNNVGVELNTASKELLARVSGISARQAGSIVAHRRQIGRFTTRRQLLDVPGIGPKTFEQAAGFLRVIDGTEPLDSTSIHPESYAVAKKLINSLSTNGEEISFTGKPLDRKVVRQLDLQRLADEWNVGLPTLQDIVDALVRPGRDPRQELPPPIFRTDLLELKDVHPGMMFHGRVTNVVDFGAFVDIGLEKAGLVHISQLADEFVRDPFDHVSVGDVVHVRVVSVDPSRGRIGLSLKSQ